MPVDHSTFLCKFQSRDEGERWSAVVQLQVAWWGVSIHPEVRANSWEAAALLPSRIKLLLTFFEQLVLDC